MFLLPHLFLGEPFGHADIWGGHVCHPIGMDDVRGVGLISLLLFVLQNQMVLDLLTAAQGGYVL